MVVEISLIHRWALREEPDTGGWPQVVNVFALDEDLEELECRQHLVGDHIIGLGLDFRDHRVT